MSKIDVMLQIGFLIQLSLFLYSFFTLKSQIERIKTTLEQFKTDLTAIKRDVMSLEDNLKKAQTDIGRFDEKGFTNLANRITESINKCTEIDHEVRRLDVSIKTFYSAWARKLGILAKQSEEAEQQANIPVMENAAAPLSQKQVKYRIMRGR